MEFSIILALDIEGGIAKSDNTLPWKISEEMEHFKRHTNNNVVIMGHNTAETFKKPLSNRINIVITRTQDYRISEGFISFPTLDDALTYTLTNHKDKKIYVIGGGVLATQAIKHYKCRNVFLSIIGNDYNYYCDTKKMPPEFLEYLGNNFEETSVYTGISLCKEINENVTLSYYEYIYKNHQETEYLKLLSKIIKTGDYRETRNAKTYSLFGEKLVFDLRKGFPLLTSKKMFYKGVVEELLFFLKGQTNTKILQDKKVKIWDGNTSKEFIEKNNIRDDNGELLKEYDMGPMYGFQWRHYNAKYTGYDKEYTEGVDQLKEVIDLLINDPHSRRILLTTYNPSQAKNGVLYPCHGIVVQFYVNGNSIDLQMYQRSADFFLGVPFNISSYATLLHIIVNLVNNKGMKNYNAGRVIMIFGDVHVYSEHVDAVRKQLQNNTYKFPELNLKRKLTSLDDLNNLEYNDFEIINYVSCSAIKADMIA